MFDCSTAHFNSLKSGNYFPSRDNKLKRLTVSVPQSPTVSAEPHLQVPGLLHVLPQHVFSQAVKHAGPYRCIWGAQAGFPQGAHQPIRVFAVKLTELCRPTVRLPSCDAVSPIKLLLYGVMVKLQGPHNRQDVASQTAETLSQQEEPVGHPSQLQMLLGVGATDAAVEKRQLGRRVDGHGETWQR